MVFFKKIEQEISKPHIRAGLKPTIEHELRKMTDTKTDAASEQFKNLLITWGFADKNFAITKDDLEKILKMIG